MRRFWIITFLAFILGSTMITSMGQRRVSPVNNAATRTQPKNDAHGDSVRALERKRARSTHYHDENGNIVFIDTVTGVEWRDSTLLPKAPPMKYPLLHALNVGVNIWDPVMRAFGQKYGGADAFVNVSLHNRYLPTFEFGMGKADNTPEGMNFTYKSPLAPYFKIGCDYNFLYNSNPDYQFYAGVRYGFSAFKFSVENVTLDNEYWGDDMTFNIPTASVSAGWFEIGLGLRVKIAGNISAGWGIKYHSVLHQTHPATGDAWYIPGYGTESSSLSCTFNVVYTLPWQKPKAPATTVDDTGGAAGEAPPGQQ